MSGLFKFFATSAVSLVVCAMATVASAVTGRGAYDNVRATAMGVGAQRMPSMPTLPIGAVGNLSLNVPSNNTVAAPSIPDVPDEPDNPDEPDEPVQECPDGGVKNSEYTVERCMNDVLNCVNYGALPNGLNDMFNEDLRNAIVNGMGLCSVQVEKCVSDVRKDCRNVYRSASDVWIDFNSRKVQPEYYNFVLRRTGLTPNQAENTCMLLDLNTYGSSFNAVANDGKTTAEYNKGVGAYNSQQGGVLIKNNPQGVQPNYNNPGVDGQRGHYARWDATTATCYLRVAAYNKDDHITNSWLFGALGDDTPAEVWKAAGDTFSCNKDLFGFSLMNDTSTAAVVGIGGGTVLGAGVGAIAGHGKREFDCMRDSHREELAEQLQRAGKIGVLNQFLTNKLSATGGEITIAQCEDIVKLYNVYNEYVVAIDDCDGTGYFEEETKVVVFCPDETKLEECFADMAKKDVPEAAWCVGKGLKSAQECADLIAKQKIKESDEKYGTRCLFKPLNKDMISGDGIYCFAQGDKCAMAVDIERQIQPLGDILESVEILRGEKSNMGKSIGIGAAVGAGTGGLATAITAFVERNNISCRVGDGLAQVGFGKSHSIGSLKDFYVKWNLRLPDVIAPTATITDCQSWKDTCATFTDLNQCSAAQFNYKPAGAATTILIPAACVPSGSACIENHPVAKSYGACE